jgi:hypothetical protein
MKKHVKALDTNLYSVKNSGNHHVAADSPEEALHLMNKRGKYSIDDIEQIGSCSTILGYSDNYIDVTNIRDKLKLLSSDKSNYEGYRLGDDYGYRE